MEKPVMTTSAYRVRKGGQIAIGFFGAVSSSGVKVRINVLLDGGQEIVFEESYSTDANGEGGGKFITMDGWITSLSVFEESLYNNGSRMYVRVTYDDKSSNLVSGVTLISGYVGGYKGLMWPQGPSEQVYSKPGYPEVISVVAPAAGSDFTYTCPNGMSLDIMAVTFKLTTSATVATRQAMIHMEEAGGALPLFMSFPGSNQAASLSYTYSFARGQKEVGSVINNMLGAQLGEMRIHPGDMLKSSVNALQAGDAITDIKFMAYIQAP